MKSVFTRIAAALVAAAAVLCFAACSESSSVAESKNDSVTTTKATGAQQQEDRLISFSVQPGGEMTKEEFEKGTTSYMVYTDGRVVDQKSNEEKKLTDDELAKLKEFADGVIGKTIKAESTNGEDMPSESVTAYDEKGSHQLSATANAEIPGYDEVYKIVRDKFAK